MALQLRVSHDILGLMILYCYYPFVLLSEKQLKFQQSAILVSHVSLSVVC